MTLSINDTGFTQVVITLNVIMLGVAFFHSYAECCCAESRGARTQTLFILISQFDLRIPVIWSKTIWPNGIWSKQVV
jgi:hypothetical protein